MSLRAAVAERAARAARRSHAFHAFQSLRARRYTRPDRNLTDRPELFDALLKDGIAVIPGYLPTETAGAWLDASMPHLEAARAGELPANTFTNQPKIICRLAPAEQFLGASSAFFEDPVIHDLMRAVLHANVTSYRHEFDYRYGEAADDEVRMADLYHFDNWHPIYKAFLYLSDVTEDSGPFVYVPGSHLGGPWRAHKEREFDSDGPTGSFGHFLPQEWRALQADYGFERRVMTGDAGTLILADLRGLHRGTPLRSGSRVLLTNVFDMMN
jgi:hypothetical protein